MSGDKRIWIVLQQRDGQLHRMSREAIAAGQQLAGALGGEASAIVLGAGIDALANEAAGYDLGAVYKVDHPSLADYTPGAYVAALAPAITAAAPDYVVFPHTYQSVDYVARLAHEAGATLVPEITAFEEQDGDLLWRRPIMSGKLQARVRVKATGTTLLTVQSGAFQGDDAVAGPAGASSELPGAGSEIVADREILGVEQVGGDHIDLTKASVVVAVGRGVGGEDKMGPIEELAAALGADIGASRPVIDNGWLPRDRQIGSSGQTVAPKLYVALGVSGAIQHVVGMKGAGTVVAVNKDPSAPIFNLARYGWVGDLHELVPALTEAIKARG